jgi:polysaccharide chain length determinant protein (PEP-CTERM system associated)
MLMTQQRNRSAQTNTAGFGPMLVFGVDVSPMSIARMIWKQKSIIVLIWTVVTIAAAVYVQRLPSIYSTSALIILDSQKIPERYVSATVNTDVQDRFATISQHILSSSHLKRIIDQFDLYREERKTRFPEEILGMLRREIVITPEKNVTGSRPGAFRISYEGQNPVVVAQVVNQIANLYIEENLKTREEQAGGTSEFIDAQLAAAKQKLDELEATVSTYKVQHNGELPQQEGSLNGILARLQIELEANRDAINRASTTKLTLEHSLSVAQESLTAEIRARTRTAPVSVAAMQPATIAAGPAKKQSDILRDELNVLRTRYSDEHPDVVALVNKLNRVQAAEAVDANRPVISKANIAANKEALVTVQDRSAAEETPDMRQARERIAGIKTQITIVERELTSRAAEQRRILSDINTYQARVTRLPIREQEMAQITRDYDIAKTNYRSLLDKKISADMAADMERRQKAERFTIADTARVPAKPTRPNRVFFRGAGCAAGLLLGIVIGLGREVRTRFLLGDWQVPAGVAVIARIPHIEHSSIETVFQARRKRWFRRSEALS